jgi:hypothetical protein
MRRTIMRAMSLRGLHKPSSGPGPRWLWSLCFALLLPLAQAAAASHAITHHGTQRDAAPTALDAYCAVCTMAAPVGTGALPSAPALLPGSDAVHAAPARPADSPPASALALAYRSRAPPLRLH